ncbi:MAG: hypothetical protein LBE78_09250 [Burkholderiaceae bacterium]|jgi:hypothetical protein|nr:hypothetical protein [Burkholderiaceae bacterium]
MHTSPSYRHSREGGNDDGGGGNDERISAVDGKKPPYGLVQHLYIAWRLCLAIDLIHIKDDTDRAAHDEPARKDSRRPSTGDPSIRPLG